MPQCTCTIDNNHDPEIGRYLQPAINGELVAGTTPFYVCGNHLANWHQQIYTVHSHVFVDEPR